MPSPFEEGVENRHECVAGVGEPVFVADRPVVVRGPGDDACAFESLESGRDAVPRRAGAGDDVAEAGGPERDLAYDEQRPSFTDETERCRDRAGPTGKVGQRDVVHAASVPVMSLKIKLTRAVLRTSHDRNAIRRSRRLLGPSASLRAGRLARR